MSSMKWTHWRLDLTGVAVIAGLSVIAYFGLVSPAIAHHEMAQAQGVELAVQRNKARDLDRSLRAVHDQLTQMQTAIEKANFKLDPPTALNERLAMITDVAGRNRLQVDTIESGVMTPFPRYSTIAIRLSGRGSYRSCSAMLKQIRETMPDVGVSAIQMTSAGVNTDINATFAIELLWHTQPQQKSATK